MSGSLGSKGSQLFHMADLNTIFSLPLLERYLGALELHLEQAYARRANISEGAVLKSKPSRSAVARMPTVAAQCAVAVSRPRPSHSPAPPTRSVSPHMHRSANVSTNNALDESRVEAFVAPLQSPVATVSARGQRMGTVTAATGSGLQQQRGRAGSAGSSGGSLAPASGSSSPTLVPHGLGATSHHPATSAGAAAAAAAASIAAASHASSSRVPLRISVSNAGAAATGGGSLRVSPAPSHPIVRRGSDGRPLP